MFEKRVGPAVQQRDRHDVVALLGDVQHRVVDGRAAGAEPEPGNPAFQRRAALLQHVGRRVHDPGVNISGHRQIEQVRAMLSVVELVHTRDDHVPMDGVDPAAAHHLDRGQRRRVGAGRPGDPAEFAAACAFLCSRRAAYITAQNILIDGGLFPGTM